MNPTQQAAVLEVVIAVFQAVAASPHGIPGGHLYAALMTQGCTLQQFEGVMAMMVRVGMVKKTGEVYTVVAK